MPKTKKKTKAKSNNLLNWLNPNSSKQRLLLFVLVFTIVGGGYMAYRSFAATPCKSSTFRQGSLGTCVSNIQYMVNGLNNVYKFAGNPPTAIKVTGKYDAPTALMIGGFQQWSHIKVDGVVGPQTWAQMCNLTIQPYFSSPQRPLVVRQAYLGAVASGCSSYASYSSYTSY